MNCYTRNTGIMTPVAIGDAMLIGVMKPKTGENGENAVKSGVPEDLSLPDGNAEKTDRKRKSHPASETSSGCL